MILTPKKGHHIEPTSQKLDQNLTIGRSVQYDALINGGCIDLGCNTIEVVWLK